MTEKMDDFKEKPEEEKGGGMKRMDFLRILGKGIAGLFVANTLPEGMFADSKEGEPTWTLEQLRGFLKNILGLDLITLSKDKENGGGPLAQLELEKVIRSIAPFKGTAEEAKEAIVFAVLDWGDEGEDNVLYPLKEILSEKILEVEEDSGAEKEDTDVVGKIETEETEKPTAGEFNFNGIEVIVSKDHIEYFEKGFIGWYEDLNSDKKEERSKIDEYLPERIIYVLKQFNKLPEDKKKEALKEMEKLGIKNQHWICTIAHTCPNEEEHGSFIRSNKIPKKNEMGIKTKYWKIGPKDGIWFYGCEHKKMDVRTSYHKDTIKKGKEAWKRHVEINRQRQGSVGGGFRF